MINIYQNTNIPEAGFFGLVGAGGIIKNLGIESGTITCLNNEIGALVGRIGNATISNCYNNALVIGKGYVGGIVGYSDASNINGCYNSGEVVGEIYTGGIVGFEVYDSIVSDCYNSATVRGSDVSTGGIVGYEFTNNEKKGKVQNCYNWGFVFKAQGMGHPIVMNENGQLSNCFYLEGCGTLDNYDKSISKTSAELKNLHTTLGSNFAKDEYNINNGYPILKWQVLNKK